MKKYKTLLSILFLPFILAISGCGSSPKQAKVEPAVIPAGSQFTVKDFNIDLVQKLSFPNYLDQEQTRELMEMAFLAKLEEEGLLADNNDPKAIPLKVQVDYRRVFAGEGTPFPIDSIGVPRAYYSVYAVQNGKKQSIYFSKERTIKGLHYFKKLSEESIKRDASFSVSIAFDVVTLLKEEIPTYEGYVKNPDAIEKLKDGVEDKFAEFQKQPQPTMDRSYIPESVTAPLLADILSSQRKKRMDAYEEIQDQWLNQPKLFDPINEAVLASYKKALSKDELDELEEQIKTLTEAGLTEYLNTLELVAKEGSSEQLRNFAKDSIKEMEARHLKSYQIHLPLPNDVTVSWQEHQLYNMTIANDLYLKKKAVKRIYRDHRENEFLLDALSKQLDTAVNRGYRPSLYADYHAWICRVLGVSGNQKYKAQLVRLSTEATSEKVRDFAEEYADEL